MKRLLTFVTLSLFMFSAYSQQDPQFSLNMFTHAAINPGAAGSNDGVCATALIREQWLGFEGRPSSKIFNANTPLSFIGLPIGAGITITTDNVGFYKNVSFNLAGSYLLDLGSGKLGIGVDFGFNNHALSNTDWLGPGANGGGVPSDPGIPNDESAMAVDLGFGVFYKDDKMHLGVAARHLNEATMEFNAQSMPPLKRHYYITGGYNIQLPNPYFELKPSIFTKYDGASMQMDANVILEYNKRIWGGMSYRLEDAYVAMFGMDFEGGYSFGVAWDFPVTEIGTYASGSIEFFLRYCFYISADSRRGRGRAIWD
ncbi:MAG: PorP/SprF family type IX secretion system membrane protein [Bacteroidota bacterium]|nr:PorP/SprF family type IX secretion system membrane protein [Bacteroidota bacterium]